MYSHSLLCLPVCQLDQQNQEHQVHQELQENRLGQCYHAHPGKKQVKQILYYSWLEIHVHGLTNILVQNFKQKLCKKNEKYLT